MPTGSKQHFDEGDIPRWVKELPSAAADEDFRARLRSDFASGRLGESAAEPPVAVRPRRPSPRWRWMVPVAGAAAIALLAFFMLNRPPDLRVIEVAGQGEARVDGRAVPLEQLSALGGIAAGTEIETPADALVDLMADDVVLLEVTGGTRMSLPQVPGRWLEREVACSLAVGEVRIKTGSRFPGSKLVVSTPEGLIEVTGTLLSIQRDEGGTCVCVLEGVAHVGVNRDDLQPVSPGYRKVMLRDGTTEIIPVKPMHRDGVLDFDRRVGGEIK